MSIARGLDAKQSAHVRLAMAPPPPPSGGGNSVEHDQHMLSVHFAVYFVMHNVLCCEHKCLMRNMKSCVL